MVLLRDLIQAIDRLTEKSLGMRVKYCLIAINEQIIEDIDQDLFTIIFNYLISYNELFRGKIFHHRAHRSTGY
jgi:hypothetical protein